MFVGGGGGGGRWGVYWVTFLCINVYSINCVGWVFSPPINLRGRISNSVWNFVPFKSSLQNVSTVYFQARDGNYLVASYNLVGFTLKACP